MVIEMDDDFFYNERTGKMEERNKVSPDGRMFTRKHIDSDDDPEFGHMNRAKHDPEARAELDELNKRIADAKRAREGRRSPDNPADMRDH